MSVTILTHRSLAEVWNMATTQHAETFIALSFIDTGHLPAYSPAGKAQTLTFQVANHEAATKAYQYVVFFKANGITQTLAQGWLTVSDGAAVQKAVSFSMPAPDMTAQIVVELAGRSEYITFEARS